MANVVLLQEYYKFGQKTEPKDRISELLEETARAIGEPLTAAMEATVRRQGFDERLIDMLCDEVRMAKRPSWRYMCAIIKRLRVENVHTAEEYVARQTAFYTARTPVPAAQQQSGIGADGANFDQRPLDRDDFDLISKRAIDNILSKCKRVNVDTER